VNVGVVEFSKEVGRVGDSVDVQGCGDSFGKVVSGVLVEVVWSSTGCSDEVGSKVGDNVGSPF